MKRAGIAVPLRIIVVTAAFALPAASLPQTASAGWTWDEMAAVSTSSTDASAADAATAPDAGATLEGWTWDESASSADDDTEPDGWTWDEQGPATGSDPSSASALPAPQPTP
jgi:hypothetical protein